MIGNIIGAAVGGIFANKAAKKDAAAQRYAADMSALGYTDARETTSQVCTRVVRVL